MTGHVRRRWTLAALAAAAVVGCGGGSEEAAAPSARSSTRGGLPTEPRPTAPEEAAPEARPASAARTTTNTPTEGLVEPAPAEAAPVEEKPERDLGAELVRGAGDIASCVKPRKAGSGPTSLSISLEATLTENGIVTRSGARSGALEPDELDCIGKRLSSLRLAPPIEAAPRTVNATVSLTLKAPAPVGPAPGAPAAAPNPGPGYP